MHWRDVAASSTPFTQKTGCCEEIDFATAGGFASSFGATLTGAGLVRARRLWESERS